MFSMKIDAKTFNKKSANQIQQLIKKSIKIFIHQVEMHLFQKWKVGLTSKDKFLLCTILIK